MEYINIGCVPAEEVCLPAGHPLARQECAIYKRQLEREFPDGYFRVRAFSHDFGSYYEVVAACDSVDPRMNAAAWSAESAASPIWDDIARKEIQELRASDENVPA